MSRCRVNRYNQTLLQPHLAVLGCVPVCFTFSYPFQAPCLTNSSQGLSIKQAEYAVKKYSFHRRIPAKVMMDLQILDL